MRYKWPNQTSVNTKLCNRPKKAIRVGVWFEDGCPSYLPPIPWNLSNSNKNDKKMKIPFQEKLRDS